MELKDIQKKIKKLLALAEGNANQEESATALGMANSLMQKYKIEKIELGQWDDEYQKHFFTDGTSRKTWKDYLLSVLSMQCGVIVVNLQQGRTMIYGKSGSCESFLQLKEFCEKEIDRLTLLYAVGRGKSFANSFRIGCVMAIKTSMDEERKRLLTEGISDTALVILNSELKDAMKALQKEIQIENRAKRSTIKTNDGLHAGRVAGQAIYGNTKTKLRA